jgi:hypothetical protein
MADIEKLGAKYRQILDDLDELEREYKAQKKQLSEDKDVLEQYAKEFMQENQMDSLQTSRVTFSLKEQKAYKVTDWEEFYDFIIERKDPNFLQRRVKSTELDAWLEENDTLPPGVESESFIRVNHRRKN